MYLMLNFISKILNIKSLNKNIVFICFRTVYLKVFSQKYCSYRTFIRTLIRILIRTLIENLIKILLEILLELLLEL